MKVSGLGTKSLHCPVDGEACLAELALDGGSVGRAVLPATAVAPASELVAECLAGEDGRAIVALWQRLAGRAAAAADSAWLQAAAALDVALWDARASARGEPLWKTLGGDRPRAPVCVLAPAMDDPADLGKQLRERFGISECTLTLDNDEPADVHRLDRLRESLGRSEQHALLRLRSPAGWPVERVIERVRALETRFDIASVELAADDETPAALKRLSESVFAAACGGQTLTDVRHLEPYFRTRAVDLLRIDIRRTGISGALLMADAAFGLELPVSLCRSPGNLAAQLAPAMPYFASMDIDPPGAPAGALRTDLRIEDGRAIAGDSVGIGWRLSAPAPEDAP